MIRFEDIEYTNKPLTKVEARDIILAFFESTFKIDWGKEYSHFESKYPNRIPDLDMEETRESFANYIQEQTSGIGDNSLSNKPKHFRQILKDIKSNKYTPEEGMQIMETSVGVRNLKMS